MERFTNREKEVIKFMIMGLNNLEISNKLVISNHTTKAHITSIYKKLCVTNRVQAVVKILQLGALEYFKFSQEKIS